MLPNCVQRKRNVGKDEDDRDETAEHRGKNDRHRTPLNCQTAGSYHHELVLSVTFSVLDISLPAKLTCRGPRSVGPACSGVEPCARSRLEAQGRELCAFACPHRHLQSGADVGWWNQRGSCHHLCHLSTRRQQLLGSGLPPGLRHFGN